MLGIGNGSFDPETLVILDQSEAVPSAALTALWPGARLGANKSNVRRAVLARMQSLGAIHETPKQFP
jgi:hypothetical protein